MTDEERPVRRTRRRASAPAGAPRQPAADQAPVGLAPESTPPTAAPPRAKKKAGPRTRAKSPDRGMHDLAGGGTSQVGISRALRARDVNRPGPDELAAAERELTIVRRNWRPQ